MNEITILPMEVEKSIKKYIDKKFDDDGLHSIFQNPLLREDVLGLLDRYCTVVYYPLEHEENNGFRVKEIPFSDGSCCDFVFINTAQTMEKQVFTAAHELGHIWNVDDVVIAECGLKDTPVQRELIINRFAATLLIPSENFIMSVRAGLKQYGNEDKKMIKYENLIKMIAGLMNQFFAPLKAITLRLVELKFFNKEAAELILGYGIIPKDQTDALLNKVIIENGYVNLQKPSYRKWIEGIAEKLSIAEKNNLISQGKIKMLRKKFELESLDTESPEINDNLIPLDTQEGLEA